MTDRSSTPSSSEGPTWVRQRGRYLGPLLVSELPSEVPFGFVSRLLLSTDLVEMTLDLHRVPSAQALDLLQRARSTAEAELGTPGAGRSERPRLEAEAESAATLASNVATRREELWRVGLCFAAATSSLPRSERLRSRLQRRLSELRFRTTIPRYRAADLVGPADPSTPSDRPLGYWHTLSSDGVAAFFPFVEEMTVEPGGILLGLLLEDAAPIVIDRWRRASYSWGLFGTTGSGKSFAAAMIALRSRWVDPDLDLIFLDPLGEFARLTERLGGAVVRPGNEGEGRLNPLDPETTEGDRDEKSARVGVMLRALFPSLLDEEAAVLDSALRRLYDSGPATPTFRDLLDVVHSSPGSQRLEVLLQIFTSGSLRGLDGPSTVDWGRSPLDLDLHHVPESQIPFHLVYLLDSLYARLRARGGRKLVVIDEAHLLARHAGVANFLDRVIRHLRHFHAGVLLLSQQPDDLLQSPGGRAVLRNLSATMLFRQPSVSADTQKFFGLTDAETEWLPRARLPKDAGYSEALLRLGPSHLPLAVVASTPEFEWLSGLLGSEETTADVRRVL